MPRPPRQFVPGGIYHIAARASDDRSLFVTDDDRTSFLDRLARVVERHEVSCVAYCLMGNHYHLIAQVPDEQISRGLQELHGGYARQFNRLHGHAAHLFRHHYLAHLIDSDAYLLTACRYLAHNPVRASLCRDPDDWPWSSHRATAGLDPSPPMLEQRSLRDAFGGTTNWRTRYRDFIHTDPEPTEL
jgi:REP element-mobilizing transposase RayT